MKYLLKIALLFPFSICIIQMADAQNYQYNYFLNNDLASTSEETATFIGKGIKEDGLVRLDCFGKWNPKLLFSMHFKDSTLAELQGYFKSFYESGKIELEGNYGDGYEDGLWLKYDTLSNIVDSSIYNKGIRVIYAHSSYIKSQLSEYIFKDSLNDIYKYESYSENKKYASASFTGSNGILTIYNGDEAKQMPVTTREIIDAYFTGGKTQFLRFLRQNLDASTPEKKKAKPGTYTVIVKLTISETGAVENVKAETNWGHGMEEEVVRVLKGSPAWVPARIFGINVKSQRRQPVTFVVSEE